MKKLFFFLIVLALGALSSTAQKESILDTVRVYRITECYYKTQDSTINLSNFFKKGLVTEVNMGSYIMLTIEKEWENVMSAGRITQIEKPAFAYIEDVNYYRYDIHSDLFYSEKPALFYKKLIEDSYEEFGVWCYFWGFRFRDQSELEIFAFDGVNLSDEPLVPLESMIKDSSFVKK